MAFLLSSDNVFDYLLEQGLCEPKDRASVQVTAKEFKNFNLLVCLDAQRSFLVKQERPDAKGNIRGEFWHEWQVHELFQTFSELKYLQSRTSEILHFDSSHSILILNYLNDYTDLSQFYSSSQMFPTAIASSLGATLAAFHQSTYEHEPSKEFLTGTAQPHPIKIRIPQFLRGLERIGPGVFSQICTDGLDFWRLYQRYESLHQAMADVSQTFNPCCLTHNDLNLRNILLDIDSVDREILAQEANSPTIKLIDWEFVSWGDPAYDLGMVLSSYLKLWLGSLVVSNTINIETALRLATTPLEQLQPSLAALICAYLSQFPEILDRRPNFLKQAIQFTGLILIKRIQGKLEQLSPFNNTSICTLQVAKALLCRPEESIPTIFGTAALPELGKLLPAYALS
jgi:Phosphotransferase enzyme family